MNVFISEPVLLILLFVAVAPYGLWLGHRVFGPRPARGGTRPAAPRETPPPPSIPPTPASPRPPRGGSGQACACCCHCHACRKGHP